MPPSARFLESTHKAVKPLGVSGIVNVAVRAVRDKADPSPNDLNRSLLVIQQAYRIEASRHVAQAMNDALRGYLERVADRAAVIYRMAGAKALGFSDEEDGDEFDEDFHEMVWRQALEQEEEKSSLSGVLWALPVITSAASEVYSSVSELLGNKPRASMISEVQDRAKVSGPLIAGVVETTKQRVLDVVRGAGRGFRRVLRRVRDSIGHIVGVRSAVATRTEVVRATNVGTTLAARHAWQVSHISVVGCTMIEPNGPQYRGIPTCNIQNVPVHDEALLDFHPNHSGFFVVSGFANEDGSHPTLPLLSGSV